MSDSSVETSLNSSGADGDRSGPGGLTFIPGTVIASRYRIVGRIGRGGMGEVWRADDLKLGVTVALKFLPPAFERDADRLERFLREIRLARQIAHPNVCRVHDIGEAAGRHFFSMEFVDGEDLAGLLRRIGRLPQEKAIQIAREMAAGLAAAHEQGILHRDLKPANVLLDGRGHVRLTDFGLAALNESVSGAELRSGTPGYMAPEQIEGREVSVRSDLYGLGVVLYELFTGRRPVLPASAGEAAAGAGVGPSRPSSLVDGLDPAVERVIMRCLAPQPADRPASALSVAAALPGGDPLAAALAAGETPSPEMVAAAGSHSALDPKRAALLLGLTAVVAMIWVAVGGRTRLINIVEPERPPVVMADRGREILEQLVTLPPARDEAFGVAVPLDVLAHVRSTDASVDRWDRLKDSRLPALQFWYRRSPELLLPLGRDGIVRLTDPPLRLPGEASIGLDPEGRLVGLLVNLPIEPAPGSAPDREPDWEAPIRAARLEGCARREVEPQERGGIAVDTRRAWEFDCADLPDTTLRLEVGATRGTVTQVRLLGPWTGPAGPTSAIAPQRRAVAFADQMGVVFEIFAFIAGAFLARRNLALGRGDRVGARRIAVTYFLIYLGVWVFGAHHVPSLPDEFDRFVAAAGFCLYYGIFVWVLYLAVEPTIRRRWPDALITWNRVLAGDLRDPMVGRHLLIGAFLGVALALLTQGGDLAPRVLGWPPPTPSPTGLTSIASPPAMLATVCAATQESMRIGFIIMILLVLLREMLPPFLAIAVVVVAYTPVLSFGTEYMGVGLLFDGATMLASLVVVLHSGLLPAAVGTAVMLSILRLTAVPSLGAWYAGQTWLALGLVAALALYGAWTAQGKRRP